MLKTYTLSGKIKGEREKSSKRLISNETSNFLEKMQPFPEVWLFYAEFGYILNWVCLKLFSIWQHWYDSILDCGWVPYAQNCLKIIPIWSIEPSDWIKLEQH